MYMYTCRYVLVYFLARHEVPPVLVPCQLVSTLVGIKLCLSESTDE